MGRPMKYVYLLESIDFSGEIYVGLTEDLRKRLAAHNDGLSTHTRKFKPWRLVTYLASRTGTRPFPLNTI
jgi:putative endonuclease